MDDWGSEAMEREEEFGGYQSPENSPVQSPMANISPQALEFGKSAEGNRVEQVSRGNTKGHGIADSIRRLENASEFATHVESGAQSETNCCVAHIGINNIGLDHKKQKAVGFSSHRRSKSLDLNTQLTQSVSSHPSHACSNDPSPHLCNPSPPANQDVSASLSHSTGSSKEFEATMELGEQIGFQFTGNNNQWKEMFRNDGVTTVS
ncbi:hypothetical protein L2E82_47312 [Cichorium intybus]|uniref:Uncharacterized protein n=1 Tax=Cichorium intybus TaxID=13427 RepID=A0ACB8YUZ6_CICIN|nr:hypothetical protein L2E82_47312 [Cichorium intybus]